MQGMNRVRRRNLEIFPAVLPCFRTSDRDDFEGITATYEGPPEGSSVTGAAAIIHGRRIGGKTVKSIKGAGDSFHRLRMGEHRVMYDVILDDRTILVLGIVHRRDLERWLRTR